MAVTGANDDRPSIRWGHVNLNVAELERSVAFYRLLGFRPCRPDIPYLGVGEAAAGEIAPGGAEALGLPLGARARACILELDAGYPKLDLTELAEAASPDPRPPLASRDRGWVRLCLGVRDLEAEYARLTAAGVRFRTPPREMIARSALMAICLDPDGAEIELIQPLVSWKRPGEG